MVWGFMSKETEQRTSWVLPSHHPSTREGKLCYQTPQVIPEEGQPKWTVLSLGNDLLAE